MGNSPFQAVASRRTTATGVLCRRYVEKKGLKLAPQVGLEPTTLRLTAECSTIELLRSNVSLPFKQTLRRAVKSSVLSQYKMSLKRRMCFSTQDEPEGDGIGHAGG